MREEGEKAQEPQSLHNHEQESKWLVVPPFCLKEKQGRERSRASVGSEARCLDRKRDTAVRIHRQLHFGLSLHGELSAPCWG